MRRSLHSSKHQCLQSLLRLVREEAGLRQIDLAERLGQPQSFVSKYESGDRCLDLLEIEQVCEALEIKIVDFVRRYEESC